jgi:hypothetical protein
MSRGIFAKMAETDDDVIASWQECVGTLRKRGRISAAALTVVPSGRDRCLPWPPADTGATLRRGKGAMGEADVQPPAGLVRGAEEILESYV